MAKRIVYRLVAFVILTGLLIGGFSAHADELSAGQNALMRGDESGAIQLWTEPAIHGNAEAQFRLGMMYLSGRGVAQDAKMAVVWLTMAVEKHHIGASLALAQLYLNKAGSTYDPDTAIHLLRDVADHGNTEAQRVLGQAYRKGGGVPQDFAEALHWFRLAAAKGDGEAELGLGELYRYGYGVEQSYPHAFMWFSLAASAVTDNVPERIAAALSAIKARDALEQMMSKDDRMKAVRLADACWKSKLQACD
jgi:hypothetical protein